MVFFYDITHCYRTEETIVINDQQGEENTLRKSHGSWEITPSSVELDRREILPQQIFLNCV